MHRVFVTQMAQLSPFGAEPEKFRQHLFAGASGVRDLRGTTLDADFPAPFGALVADYRQASYLSRRGLTHAPRSTHGALAVAEALAPSLGSPGAVDGLVWAGGDGTDFELHWKEKDFSGDTLALLSRGEASASLVADYLREKNISVPRRSVISLNTACTSGIVALGHAFQRLRAGQWRRAIVGSASLRVSAYDQMSSHLLGALSTQASDAAGACRPFALDRSGFVRGEAAAIFLLESDAEAPSTAPLAEILGFSQTNDAYRFTDGRPDASAAAAAISQAVGDAGLAPANIGYVSAHGTGTRLNDSLETLALKSALGHRAYEIPISALKSQLGHSSYASGAIATYATIEMLRAQRVAPTLNLYQADPECDLDYVPLESRPVDFQHALVNAFGFGGQNACLVLGRGP